MAPLALPSSPSTDPVTKMLFAAFAALESFDDARRFVVPAGAGMGGGAGLGALSIKTQLDLLSAAKRPRRVKWGGALGSTQAPSMLMRRSHFGKQESWRVRAGKKLGAGGLSLLELEEHPANVYKGYFDMRRGSAGAVQHKLLLPSGLEEGEDNE